MYSASEPGKSIIGVGRVREYLGDSHTGIIWLPESTPKERAYAVRRLFPEAKIERVPDNWREPFTPNRPPASRDHVPLPGEVEAPDDDEDAE